MDGRKSSKTELGFKPSRTKHTKPEDGDEQRMFRTQWEAAWWTLGLDVDVTDASASSGSPNL